MNAHKLVEFTVDVNVSTSIESAFGFALEEGSSGHKRVGHPRWL